MTTGTKIRILREQKHWGQEVLADALGISQPCVSKRESDQTKLSWEHAVILGKLFEVDPEYFFDSNVNNYVYNNQKVNQLFNSEYSETNVELIKELYGSQLKIKDELLEERNQRIVELKQEVADLKRELTGLKSIS